MNILHKFHEISNNSNSYIKKIKKEKNKIIIGSLCSFVPEEIINAANAVSYRILPAHHTTLFANLHLQSYSCGYIRSVLEEKISGRLDFLDAVIFPHTCDSIQRLSDIWRMTQSGIHFDILFPAKLNTKSSKEYLIKILLRFKSELEQKFSITISDLNIKKSIFLINNIKNNIKKIYNIREKNPLILKGKDIFAVQKAGTFMDKKEFLSMLLELIAELEEKFLKQKSPKGRKRLIISGNICSISNIYSFIEDLKADIIWDDLCIGSKYFENKIDENQKNIFKAIAEKYFKKSICPAKHLGIRNRGEYLLKIIKKKKIDGVIFLFLKFCDPHSFDYPYLKEMLNKEKIPCLLIETEIFEKNTTRIKTRYQAFLEIINKI
ncbi:MAG: hypothetical protein B6I26_01300 [Desulfobacteraceae bacterium 4572_130]|nr:MAG: hypothetical protein B6I26_01300 [Desulfobacteraceae bacterium 4572_130]